MTIVAPGSNIPLYILMKRAVLKRSRKKKRDVFLKSARMFNRLLYRPYSLNGIGVIFVVSSSLVFPGKTFNPVSTVSIFRENETGKIFA